MLEYWLHLVSQSQPFLGDTVKMNWGFNQWKLSGWDRWWLLKPVTSPEHAFFRFSPSEIEWTQDWSQLLWNWKSRGREGWSRSSSVSLNRFSPAPWNRPQVKPRCMCEPQLSIISMQMYVIHCNVLFCGCIHLLHVSMSCFWGVMLKGFKESLTLAWCSVPRTFPCPVGKATQCSMSNP